MTSAAPSLTITRYYSTNMLSVYGFNLKKVEKFKMIVELAGERKFNGEQ